MTRNWTWERRRCLLHRPSIWTTGRWIRDIMAQCPCPAMACIRLTGRRLVLLSRTGVIGPVLRGEAAIMMRIRGRSRIDSEACCDGAHMLAFCSAAASGMYGLIPLIMRVYYRISFRDGPVRGLIHHPGEGFRAFDHYACSASIAAVPHKRHSSRDIGFAITIHGQCTKLWYACLGSLGGSSMQVRK